MSDSPAVSACKAFVRSIDSRQRRAAQTNRRPGTGRRFAFPSLGGL